MIIISFSINLLAFYQEFCPLIGYVTFNLNNRVLLSRNYRLIVAPQKFDVLKTKYLSEKRSFEGKYCMLVLRTSNFQGATIRPIVPRHKHSKILSLLFTTKVSSARQFKNHIELFSSFLDESR